MALDPRVDSCDTHVIIRTLLKTAYKKAEIPKRWQVAQTEQLVKYNGKMCCKSARLINTTCPLGKVFFKVLWMQVERRKYYFSYVYTKHRRREQALLVQNVVAWKLRQAFLEADDPTCQD